MAKKYKAHRLGPLCADRINKTIGTELETADVWVSKAAHRHIAEDHPNDYALVWAALPKLISNPTYVGERSRSTDSFYLVTTVDIDGGVLMAISFKMSPHGTYNLQSAYTIKRSAIDNRREAKTLHILK